MLLKRVYLFSLLGIFSTIVFPVCFLNNEWPNLILGEHIDSGSILSSIIQLTDKNSPAFYNQNIPFHTLYGYPYNSILFAIFFLLKEIGKLNLNDNFFIFASIARLANFIISILIIIEINKIGTKFLKSYLSKTVLISLLVFFSPFIHYSYHVKPDLLGLLFIILSVKYLYAHIQNPDKTKNIIIANIFGGLAILCKQPHIFILAPLFFGYIIPYRHKLLNNLKKIVLTYTKSIIFFLIIFFIIHPYAFLNTQAFISKQGTLMGMVATSMADNISYWIPTYLHDPILLIFFISPLVFLIFSFSSKNTKDVFLLKLLSIYIILYFLWLTLKVGPMRFDAYLLPIYPFSLILFLYVFEHYYYQLFNKNIRTGKQILNITIVSCFLILIAKSIVSTIPKSMKYISMAHEYQLSPNYLSVKKLNAAPEIDDKKNKIIVYSASLPVSDTVFKKSSNAWQFADESGIIGFNPDILFADFTVYWEKPYSVWKKMAQELNLNQEMLFLKDTEREKNIVLFYK